jgi:hypothetical protein
MSTTKVKKGAKKEASKVSKNDKALKQQKSENAKGVSDAKKA